MAYLSEARRPCRRLRVGPRAGAEGRNPRTWVTPRVIRFAARNAISLVWANSLLG